MILTTKGKHGDVCPGRPLLPTPAPAPAPAPTLCAALARAAAVHSTAKHRGPRAVVGKERGCAWVRQVHHNAHAGIYLFRHALGEVAHGPAALSCVVPMGDTAALAPDRLGSPLPHLHQDGARGHNWDALQRGVAPDRMRFVRLQGLSPPGRQRHIVHSRLRDACVAAGREGVGSARIVAAAAAGARE